MITETLNEELKKNPSIFFPYGKINRRVLNEELQKYKFNFPRELIEFWINYGGGDLFGTETILSPIPSENEFVYDIGNINDFRYKNGLDKRYIIFQENASEMTAFDKETNEIVVLNKDKCEIEERFENINKWFIYLWQLYR